MYHTTSCRYHTSKIEVLSSRETVPGAHFHPPNDLPRPPYMLLDRLTSIIIRMSYSEMLGLRIAPEIECLSCKLFDWFQGERRS